MSKYEQMVRDAEGKRITRSRAIRLKCLDCCVYQPSEVTACQIKACPLWRYRTGREERDELYNSVIRNENLGQEDTDNG